MNSNTNQRISRGRSSGWRGSFRGGRFSGARTRDDQSQIPAATREEFPSASGGTPSGGETVNHRPRERPMNVKQRAKASSGPVDLSPKALSTTSSIEKNDPLIDDSILVDGVCGFIERTRTREFSNDYSQFPELVSASYNAQITFDRGLKKYLSFGMYQYYCTILFWRRLLYVLSQRGAYTLEYDMLVRKLNFDIPEPSDVCLYLNGIGDITDFSDRHFQLSLQAYPTVLEIHNVRGTFGRVSPQTAILYETVPAPFVALEKMRQDLMYTLDADHGRNWDLPPELRPAIQAALAPSANLLGWSMAEQLTSEQREAYQDALIDETDFGTVNIGNIPVNQVLMRTVAGLLNNSKCKAVSTPSGTPTGSVAQIPYAMRSTEDAQINRMQAISAKAAQTYCYSQASSHTASGAACFRYRVKRRRVEGMNDSSCYIFEGPIPPAWLANENQIFEAGAVELWNSDQYRISEQDGRGLATMVATRVRRKVTKI